MNATKIALQDMWHVLDIKLYRLAVNTYYEWIVMKFKCTHVKKTELFKHLRIVILNVIMILRWTFNATASF
jgi:hypothetical protein